jgi:hypothetical protein
MPSNNRYRRDELRLAAPSVSGVQSTAHGVLFSGRLIGVSPWMIRNVLWTGNLFTPSIRAYSVPCNPSGLPATGDVSVRQKPMTWRGRDQPFRMPALVPMNRFYTLTIPIRIFPRSDDTCGCSTALNPYLVIFFFAFFLG